MAAIWKGSIFLGQVRIPVALYKATEEHNGLGLHYAHALDGSRVRSKLWCEEEDKEVPYEEVTKSYEHPDGRRIVLTGQDLADLPLPSKRMIKILGFIDTDALNPITFGQAYYVGGLHRAADQPYALLRKALTVTRQVAVTKVALGTRESLAVLRVQDGLLVLQVVKWPDEVRHPADIAPDAGVTVRPQELKMIRSLMQVQSEGFDPNDLHDEYQQALQQVIDARLQGVEPPHVEKPAPAGDSADNLLAALQSSLKSAVRSCSGSMPAKKAPAKKAPVKKATAKKTASSAPADKKPSAKKTVAKKTAPRRAS
jgi:DNA end-binding protein Ku